MNKNTMNRWMNMVALVATMFVASCTNEAGKDFVPDVAGTTLRFTLPAALDGFTETETRAGVPGADEGVRAWQAGDKMLAMIQLAEPLTSPAKNSYCVFTTLTWTATADGKSSWTVDAGSDVLIHSINTSTSIDVVKRNGELNLLVKEGNQVSLVLPSAMKDVAKLKMDVTLTYAPALEWAENANNKMVDYKRKTDAAPHGTTPMWLAVYAGTEFDFTEAAFADGLKNATDFAAATFNTTSSRLRVHVGKAGVKVKLVSPNFLGAAEYNTQSDKHPADNLYTATSDANGNAYFYGTTSEELDGSSEAKSFVVSLSGLLVGGIATEVEIFEAGATNKVDMKNTVVNNNPIPTTFSINALWGMEGID